MQRYDMRHASAPGAITEAARRCRRHGLIEARPTREGELWRQEFRLTEDTFKTFDRMAGEQA